MDAYEEVPPDTLPVELVEEGVIVEYTDGREVFYRGPPERVDSPHETAPGKDVHVLVTDGSDQSGVLVYVDEKRTDAEILRDTGVGRVLLDADEETTLFPGVVVTGGNLRATISVDHDEVDGRVFVFEEDQFAEFAYELLPQTE
jgi:hypothetical protein